ncbi:unnamed protein product [Ascophyllum nodosum]
MRYSVTADGFLPALPVSPPHKEKDNASTASSSTESFSTLKPSTSSSLSSSSSSRLRRPSAGFGYGNGYRSSLADTLSTSRTLTDDTPSSAFSSSSSSVHASPAPLPGAPMSAAAVAAAAALPPTALPSDGEDRIRVACRVKPREPGTSAAKVCTSVGGDQRTVSWAGNRADGETARRFMFDYAAGEGVGQEELFQKIGLPVTNACLEGFSGTIFCYGQTGSGKSYTTFGPPDEASWIKGTGDDCRGDGRNPATPQSGGGSRGLVPRVLEHLLDRFSDGVDATTQPGGQSTSGLGPSEVQNCRCSFYEIYNEQVYDLTVPEGERASLNIREATGKGIFLEGVSEMEVKTAREACEILRKGYASRHTASTAMNSSSSRSHAIFTLAIDTVTHLPHQPEGDFCSTRRGRGQGAGKKALEDGRARLRSARFNLVDLAGSESQQRTRSKGAVLKEGTRINQSLSALGRVINSLVEGEGSGHVPYRDSKLTRLLAHSLGGNSKTVLVATVSGDVVDAGETLSTLKFVQRAKIIKNRAIRNEATHGGGLALQQVEEENARLKKLLADQERLSSQAKLKLREVDSHRSRLAMEVVTLREEAKRNKEIALEALQQLSECQSKVEESQKAVAEKERQLEEAAVASRQGEHRERSVPGAVGGKGEGSGSTGGGSTGGGVPPPTPTSHPLLRGLRLLARRLRFASDCSGGSHSSSCFGAGINRSNADIQALAEKERQLEEAAAASPQDEHGERPVLGAVGGKGEGGGSTGGGSTGGGVPPPTPTSPPLLRGIPLLTRRLRFASDESGGSHSSSPFGAGIDRSNADIQSNTRDEIVQACQRWPLQIHDELYGTDHPKVAWDLANLVKILMEKGDFDAAESLVRSALEIRSRFLGPAHADVACSLFDLALIYRIKGNREKADLFEAEGNRIWGRAFGDRYQEEAPPERRPAVGTE